MTLQAFFHWLGTPIRAVRGLFPFTHDGRQTLIYLMCALSAPVLSMMVIWILDVQASNGQWQGHREIARIVAYALLIAVCAFSMFVAFKSLSLGSKDGLLSLSGKDGPDPAVRAAKQVEQKVRTAATEAVAKVEANAVAPTDERPDYAR